MTTAAPSLPDFAPISTMLFADEAKLVHELCDKARLSEADAQATERLARRLVEAVRKGRRQQGGIDAFMQEYALSSEEGVVLMCLAEALLRIPDAGTADKLIADKIGEGQWERHVGRSDSLFVNASTWGLMLTGRFIELGGEAKSDALSYVKRLTGRSSEPFIRQAMRHAMRIMGRQFVLGRTMKEALSIARPLEAEGYRFSFDMLGEAAMTMADADRYLGSYKRAMADVAAGAKGEGDIFSKPSISVKLSALHPRYQEKERGRTMDELLPRVAGLAADARRLGIGLTIDAEEMERLELSLELFGRLANNPELAGWNGLGMAVQAYAKRGLPVIEWLNALAGKTGRVLPLRLVKGAYWDTEIKRAQEGGFDDFPLFTRKVSTDVSYLACARYLLQHRERFYPQFATHNAHSLAAVATMAGNREGFEFQRLHGMGQALYDEVVGRDRMNLPCRIYAPVGSHEDLLAYLVRRLLENGANTSFVHRLADDDAPIREIIADPVKQADALDPVRHPRIALPARIFGERTNSRGLPLWDNATRAPLVEDIRKALARPAEAGAVINGKTVAGGGCARRHLAARPLGHRRQGARGGQGGNRGRACRCPQGTLRLERAGRRGAGENPRKDGRSV